MHCLNRSIQSLSMKPTRFVRQADRRTTLFCTLTKTKKKRLEEEEKEDNG